jgi:hypothetical protein
MSILTNDDLKSKAYSRKEADAEFVRKDVFIEELREASIRSLDDEKKLDGEIGRSVTEDTKFDNSFGDLWGDYDPDKGYDKESNAPSEDSLLASLFGNYRLPVPPEEAVFEGFDPDGARSRFALPENLDYRSAVLAFKNGVLLDGKDNEESPYDGCYDYFLSQDSGIVYIEFSGPPGADDKIQVSYIKKKSEIPSRIVKTYQLTPSKNINLYPMPSDTDYSYIIKVFMNGVFLDDDTDYQINSVQKSIAFTDLLDEDDEILIHYLSTSDIVIA